MRKVSGLLLVVMMFSACGQTAHQNRKESGLSGSWEMRGFVKADSLNPILSPSGGQVFHCPVSRKNVMWEERNVLNPSAVVKDDTVYLIYRAQDNEMTSRLGLAVSTDGLHFRKEPDPVFYPDNDSLNVYEWSGGVEDPRITESDNGIYIMTYTAYDGKTARLCLASSKDLRNWTKHGLVIKEGKYRDYWSKSGTIVSMLDHDQIIAVRIEGLYWMYFGDTNLFMATSEDLIHWNILEDPESGKPIPVMYPRPGYFDSKLVEPGPAALLEDEGILLIYNGSNSAIAGDQSLPRFAYSAGQALFDKRNPFKLLDRSRNYFIHPDKQYEKAGEVNEVCFVEGLVFFNERWFLYYGTADSKIAVAVK